MTIQGKFNLQVSKFLEKLEDEMKQIDMMEESREDQIQNKISRYENYLEKKSRLLPPKSYLLLQVSGSLAILLGKSKKVRALNWLGIFNKFILL